MYVFRYWLLNPDIYIYIYIYITIHMYIYIYIYIYRERESKWLNTSKSIGKSCVDNKKISV